MLWLLVSNFFNLSFSYQTGSVPPTRSADPPSPSNTVGSDQVCNISDLLYSDNLLNRPVKRMVFYDLSPLDALFDSQIRVQFFIFVHFKIKWSIPLCLCILFVFGWHGWQGCLCSSLLQWNILFTKFQTKLYFYWCRFCKKKPFPLGLNFFLVPISIFILLTILIF